MEQETPNYVSSNPNADNKLIDVLKIEGAWKNDEGFPQPDWKCIGQYIKLHYAVDTQPDVWDEACIQWVDVIRYVLGPTYQVYESDNFLILTTKTPNNAQYALNVCENVLKRIREALSDLAWKWKNGKHIVYMFEDVDLYLKYISHFYPEEGEYSMSFGIFLNQGYCHSALPPLTDIVPALIHCLTYLSLAQLHIPKWIKYGLAFVTKREVEERTIERRRGQVQSGLNEELFTEQKDYWNKSTIQDFWSGKSFADQNHNQISEIFAQILVENIQDAFPKFNDFVKDAKISDAGEASAMAHLGVSLNEIITEFLGKGVWTPNPIAMKDT